MSEWQTTNKAVSVWGGVSAAISVPLPKCANTRKADSSATRLKQQIQKYRQRDAGPKEDKDWLFAYLPQPCQLTSASWICLDDEDVVIKKITLHNLLLFKSRDLETKVKSFQRSGWRGLSRIFRSGRWYNHIITTHRICLSVFWGCAWACVYCTIKQLNSTQLNATHATECTHVLRPPCWYSQWKSITKKRAKKKTKKTDVGAGGH